MIRFTESAPFVAVEYTYEVEKILYKKKSKFQDIMVFENSHFGKMLILDRVVQITERDEFFYHEMLCHVAMCSHPDPKRVVVVGGGDGGTVREVLKHKGVEKVYFIEIDPDVISVSREFFPSVACGMDDPRVEIRNMDGAEFIKQMKGQIDVILVDSTDPIGFARTLFSKEFYTSIKESLREGGIYVTHSDSLLLHSDITADVQKTLREVFPVVDLYTAPIATYPGNWWAFSISTMGTNPRTIVRVPDFETKYYDDEVHGTAFLTKKLYQKLLDGKLNW